MLPFEQFGQITVNREGLLAIEIGRQTGPDLASEAAEARRRCSSVLSVIGVPLLPVLGEWTARSFLLWRSMTRQKFSMTVAVR